MNMVALDSGPPVFQAVNDPLYGLMFQSFRLIDAFSQSQDSALGAQFIQAVIRRQVGRAAPTKTDKTDSVGLGRPGQAQSSDRAAVPRMKGSGSASPLTVPAITFGFRKGRFWRPAWFL